MKIAWKRILNTCLSGFIVAWAFADGVQAAVELSLHHYVGAVVLCVVDLLLVAGVIWRDYWIQSLNNSLYEHKDLSNKLVEQQAREIAALQHIAFCAVAVETAVTCNVSPNMEPLKQSLNAYEVMRTKANVKPN